MVTSYALSGDDVKAFEAGCDAYVTKPFVPRELLAKVREYLGYDAAGALVRTPPLILVVDDKPANVDILQLRLDAHGYDVLTATDGEAALTAVREALPDLILLDVMMPRSTGSRSAAAPGRPVLPVHPDHHGHREGGPEDVVAGLEAGGDEYLTKPVDQGALVARVKSMLRIKELHDTVRGAGR